MNLSSAEYEDLLRRKPHLGKACLTGDSPPPVKPRATAKRLRQSHREMNKLELAWFDHLQGLILLSESKKERTNLDYSGKRFYSQSITFKLANGLRYMPDFFSFEWPAAGESDRPTAWETKGHMREDAAAKLKMFAHEYPQIRVILVWKENGLWQTQRILP